MYWYDISSWSFAFTITAPVTALSSDGCDAPETGHCKDLEILASFYTETSADPFCSPNVKEDACRREDAHIVILLDKIL